MDIVDRIIELPLRVNPNGTKPFQGRYHKQGIDDRFNVASKPDIISLESKEKLEGLVLRLSRLNIRYCAIQNGTSKREPPTLEFRGVNTRISIYGIEETNELLSEKSIIPLVYGRKIFQKHTKTVKYIPEYLIIPMNKRAYNQIVKQL